MDPEEINVFTRRRPFLPFRLHVVDGESFDILHPDWVALGRTTVFVGMRRDVDSPYFDEPVVVALRHVSRIEPLVEELSS